MKPALIPKSCHHSDLTTLLFLHHLMASICSRDTGVAVALCIRMKNPYIKKGTLPAIPEPMHKHVYQLWRHIASWQWLEQHTHM